MSLASLLGLAIAAVVLVLLVVYYAWVYRRNSALGTPGVISRVRLTCPKCGGTFDLDYVPGAAVTAFRLGRSRYMACPLCHKWSTFDMTRNRLPVEPRGAR